uniref:Uncharacterized protein n=1 Tax=Poecilia latipinna TaxID=48699 RepID=A0A3B3VB51_9TELE
MPTGVGLRRVVSSTYGRRQAGADANQCGQCQKIPICEGNGAAACGKLKGHFIEITGTTWVVTGAISDNNCCLLWRVHFLFAVIVKVRLQQFLIFFKNAHSNYSNNCTKSEKLVIIL